jgi:hypothetical protein
MKNRYLVFGLSIVLALALAVPALGGPTNPVASLSASAKSIAKKALKKAKTAQKKAESAQSAANAAQSTANTANTAAGKAQTTANTANTAAGKAQTSATSASTEAKAAQTAADKAQATANEAKSLALEGFTETDFEDGPNESGSGEAAIAAAGCPEGFEPTGGGFVLLGSDSNKVRVDLNSQYLNGWIVSAENIAGHAGENWELSAAVTCIG